MAPNMGAYFQILISSEVP